MMKLNEVGAAVNSPSHNDMSRSNYSKKYLKFAQNYEKIDISEQELAKMNKELRLSESDLERRKREKLRNILSSPSFAGEQTGQKGYIPRWRSGS